MRRFSHIFTGIALRVVVALTLAGMVAPCLCWAHERPSCHATAEMDDCCCSKDATVDSDMPTRGLAVLPIEWQNPPLDLTAAMSPIVVLSHPISLPLLGHDRGGSLRSPPCLYLLHAAFRL